ncbi:BTAD domain-containing putative transcriptional regulator [Streptomyces goshikiensis]|uniref:BTAD domain-containing putative transcriptional regulator n=1 Tax=Streptomyces goshikiensis TaxID=1942 RepID=UPI00382D23B8
MEFGGIRQRAALAYLLMHSNQVVSTSQLLGALWVDDDAPVTARKILQNAIWRLRGVLAGPSSDAPAPRLLTRSPGYTLQVQPGQVDLLDFQQRVAAGRAALAGGDPQSARDLLTGALALWRGPVLSDLVEEGICWPEVTALQNKRVDVMEDRFEAELACGGHQGILHELKTLVESDPLRERASRQLMLALYRCGRQAEALAVYGKVREELVGGLGLEPSRELQRLQQSVLTQDPALDPPRNVARLRPAEAATTAPRTAEERWPRPAEPAAPAPAPAAAKTPGADDATRGADAGSTTADRTRRAAGSRDDERRADAQRPTSVLLVRFGLGAEFGTLSPEDMDRALDALTMLACEKIGKHGGMVASALGSLLLGVFEDDGREPSGAVRAVRAAAEVRDCLNIFTAPGAPGVPVAQGLSVYGAVVTWRGVSPWPGTGTTAAWAGDGLVDSCQVMLASVAPGEVHVCDTTRRLTEAHVTYRHACASASAPWELMAVTDGTAGGSELSFGDRECELDLMRGMLGRTRQRAAPHLITVLATPGSGKTRLLMEFQRRVEEDPVEPMRVLTATAPPPGTGSDSRMPADVLAAYCGIRHGDDATAASTKISAALARLTDDEETRRTLPALLRPLLGPGGPVRRETLAAWQEFLALAAGLTPLVMIWDDLHHADDMLLDALEELVTAPADVPVLHVVAADERLLGRRPHWSAGHPHAMVISLLPVPDDALDLLLESLLLPKRQTEPARAALHR